MNQVAKDEQLFDAARDYFYFVTTFFEPINISATHIYHSALELSPVPSAVRRLHYHRRPTPFPRVAVGTPDSWDPSIAISNIGYSRESSIAWSPCGHFVATQTKEVVEIRDPLTFELLSTLKPTKPTSQLTGPLAYSPDRRSLACVSNTTFIVWDIQTGGVAKELQYDKPSNESLVWSSDGGTISTVAFYSEANTLTVRRYDVPSATALPSFTLRSEDKPHLWVHNDFFRVITTVRDGEACTIDIFDVGPIITKAESFSIQLEEHNCQIKSFSPTTYRISVLTHGGRLLIFDIRNSGRLLDKGGAFDAHRFSPDGSVFAAAWQERVHAWKYDGSGYTPWRQFPTLAGSIHNLLFSPDSSSILVNLGETLKLWRFDGPYVDSAIYVQQLAVPSRSGIYLATTSPQESTVTVSNHLLRTPPQVIDTDIKIRDLGLTGNVLLVGGSEVIVAWLLTEEGLVNGVVSGRRAGRGDSIWTVSARRLLSRDVVFSAEGEIGVIKSRGNILRVYNIGTGEVLEPARTPLHLNGPWHSLPDMMRAWPHLHDGSVGDVPRGDDWKPSRNILKEGWMKDREGRHLLWLPAKWRAVDWNKVDWFSSIATIRFVTPSFTSITKLY